MSNIDVSVTVDSIFKLSSLIIEFFGGLFYLLFNDLWTLMREVDFPFLDYVLDAIEWIGLDVFFSSITLAGLLFSLAIILVIVVKFFIE